ncbi:efflux RND transporter periplasmic adaptor subunit [Herminiimonas sp. CN]|uniref:efflux RND transporter periplasmic adaptor subunit n=1 Tax=Herminiimonas sp. CN TaxID=1349818 RepID=UPI0009DD4DE3|nr:efflux RND transporter periplasmic adaptor subunit [Herminiimonas sp. CN]
MKRCTQLLPEPLASAILRWSALAATHLLAASFVLGAAAVSAQPAAAPIAPAVAPAASDLVAYREVPQAISAEGVAEAVRQSTLAAQIPGQIVELRVKVGDRVKAGQILVRIDPRAAEQALSGSQSQVAEAQANLNNALHSFERSKKLFSQKFISQAGLDQAQADYTAAQARVAALQAGAGQASTAKTFTIISAPYDGVIAATPVEVGDMATPGLPLLTLFDPSAMRVTATLSQSSLSAIQLQQPARVEFPALKKSINARQITLIPLADSRTHTARLRLDLGEVAGLLPGQFARAYFVTGMARKLVVPEQAVLRRSEVTAVYVLDSGKGQPQLRQIRVGEVSANGFIEVLAGVRAGERVARDPVRAGLISATDAATR